MRSGIGIGVTAIVLSACLGAPHAGPAPVGHPVSKATPKPPTGPARMMALPLKLPHAPFISTWLRIPPWTTADRKSLNDRRGPFLVPVGTKLLSVGKPVTSSDARPIIGTLSLVTDGEKSAQEGNWVELMPGKQWVQI